MKYEKLTKAELIQEIKKLNRQSPKVNVSNNIIEMKVWDEDVILGINDVAKALLNLTELFKSENIEITAIKLEKTN
jgi:hypothetical protein